MGEGHVKNKTEISTLLLSKAIQPTVCNNGMDITAPEMEFLY